MKKRLILVCILLLIILFTLSCTVEESAMNESQEDLEAEERTGESDLVVEEEQQTEGMCTPNWICISRDFKMYQDENCVTSQKKKCTLGCINGTCKAAKICASGFKCRDDFTRGFQNEGCQWTDDVKCDWGCDNNKCLPMPENATLVNETVDVENVTVEEEVVEEEAVIESIFTVSIGEEKTINVNSVEYSISVYNIEADQARLNVNDRRSGWLKENQNFTYGSELIIYIKEILFQSFPGGKKTVGYTIN